MARIKTLEQLAENKIDEIVLGKLPERIRIQDYALEKGYMINELVKKVHGGSYEWYGFLVANKDDPELVIDVGLGKNADNGTAHTKMDAEEISRYHESLPAGYITIGWIHSHGNLGFRQFSGTDDENMLTVLNYASLVTRRPILKREVLIDNLSVLEPGYDHEALKKGSVSVIIDGKANSAKIYETIFGSFIYSIVVGDEKWHEDEISYERKSLLTGEEELTKREGELEVIVTGRKLSEEPDKIKALKEEVKNKIKPYSFSYGSFKRKGKKWKKGRKNFSDYVPRLPAWLSPASSPINSLADPECAAVEEVEEDGMEAFPTSTGVLYRPRGKPIFPQKEENSKKDQEVTGLLASSPQPYELNVEKKVTTIKCPSCSNEQTKLLESKFFGTVFGYAKRECEKCHTQFTTAKNDEAPAAPTIEKDSAQRVDSKEKTKKPEDKEDKTWLL